MADRVFLDANVLFSAAYREGSSLLRLWIPSEATILTSGYAADEALRNAIDDAHLRRMVALLDKTSVVFHEAQARSGLLYIETDVVLPDKDWPILLAAIDVSATHLLTGDKQHFGPLFDTTIHGVLVQTPAAYLRLTST